jgi:putative membrane protein
MRLIAAAAVIAAVIITPAAAQFGNPGGADPATRESSPGVPVPNQTNVQDRLFVMLAGQGGRAEVELAKVAEQKSKSAAVVAFAKQMVAEHGKSNERLAQLAKQTGIPLPADLAPDQKLAKETLEALDPGLFDAAYMRVQVVDHQKTVLLLQWEIGSGENADLQRFASETLPAVLHHLQLTQSLVAVLTGAAAF